MKSQKSALGVGFRQLYVLLVNILQFHLIHTNMTIFLTLQKHTYARLATGWLHAIGLEFAMALKKFSACFAKKRFVQFALGSVTVSLMVMDAQNVYALVLQMISAVRVLDASSAVIAASDSFVQMGVLKNMKRMKQSEIAKLTSMRMNEKTTLVS